MSEIDIMLDDSPVFVQIAPPVQVNVSVAQPPQIGVMVGSSIVYLDIDQPVPINVSMPAPPLVQMSVNPVAGPPGPRGPQGIPGVRGSLMVGAYVSEDALPNPNSFLPGDYAFAQDTGELWQVITES